MQLWFYWTNTKCAKVVIWGSKYTRFDLIIVLTMNCIAYINMYFSCICSVHKGIKRFHFITNCICCFRLSVPNLSETGCEGVSSVLRSQYSSLRELDLSINSLEDSGFKIFSTALESPHCRLETLRSDLVLISFHSFRKSTN